METYDSTNHLVGLDKGYPIFTTLRPNEESPFKVNTTVPRFSNDHYVVTMGPLDSTTSHPLPPPTLSNHNNETNGTGKLRAFSDCYSDLALGTLILSVITPTNITLTNLADPEVKAFFTNLCDFYHEKTGVWAGMTNFQEYGNRYGSEFNQKYNATMPESIRQLIEN